MSLGFVPCETSNPDYTVWSLVNLETVEFVDGPRDVPGEIYGSVLVPSSYNEAEAHCAFHAKKRKDALILSMLDAATTP